MEQEAANTIASLPIIIRDLAYFSSGMLGGAGFIGDLGVIVLLRTRRWRAAGIAFAALCCLMMVMLGAVFVAVDVGTERLVGFVPVAITAAVAVMPLSLICVVLYEWATGIGRFISTARGHAK